MRHGDAKFFVGVTYIFYGINFAFNLDAELHHKITTEQTKRSNMSQRILKNWFLPLLILLAFFGGRVADACDFSDYLHTDLKKSHLESSDNSAYDADDSRHKVQALVSFVPVEWVLLLPPAVPAQHEVVQFVSSSVTFPVSLPARAPPA